MKVSTRVCAPVARPIASSFGRMPRSDSERIRRINKNQPPDYGVEGAVGAIIRD